MWHQVLKSNPGHSGESWALSLLCHSFSPASLIINIGMLCIQELFYWSGWITWNIVSDIYIFTNGKKSMNVEKNENVELAHTQVFCGGLCVVQITVTKKKLYWCHVYLLVQNADCRLDKKCRPGTKCRLQTAERVQNTDWESKELFCLVCDNMSSRNLPSVTQSLFRDQLSRLFALLWNIPGPFLDQNRS